MTRKRISASEQLTVARAQLRAIKRLMTALVAAQGVPQERRVLTIIPVRRGNSDRTQRLWSDGAVEELSAQIEKRDGAVISERSWWKIVGADEAPKNEEKSTS